MPAHYTVLLGERNRRSFIRINGWLLLREVGRVVFVLGADGGLRLNVGERLARLAVLLVGQFPEDAGDSVGVVTLRKLAGGNAGEPLLFVGVIEVWGADPHADVSGTMSGAS